MKHARSIQKFHQKLHDWYAREGRHDLPWRNTRDSYAIYISEVMLQQTQVKTVLERFYWPFLEKFPTLQSLADAPRDAVMKAWEGLGYYTRAANLHEAAKRAAPQLPSDVDALNALPGIGRNTAHAVAAFSHNAPVPVMEANVKRVLCRIFALKTPKPDDLWDKAFQFLDAGNPFDYNQAMMDIGAMVCLKRAPKCAECPANGICEGIKSPEEFPAKTPKKPIQGRRGRAGVVVDKIGRFYLLKRNGKFLNGLYGFPLFWDENVPFFIENRNIVLSDGQNIGEVSQTYSHFRSEAEVMLVQLDWTGEGEDWHRSEELEGMALSGIDHKIWQKASAFLQNCQKTFTIRGDEPAL